MHLNFLYNSDNINFLPFYSYGEVKENITKFHSFFFYNVIINCVEGSGRTKYSISTGIPSPALTLWMLWQVREWDWVSRQILTMSAWSVSPHHLDWRRWCEFPAVSSQQPPVAFISQAGLGTLQHATRILIPEAATTQPACYDGDVHTRYSSQCHHHHPHPSHPSYLHHLGQLGFTYIYIYFTYIIFNCLAENRLSLMFMSLHLDCQVEVMLMILILRRILQRKFGDNN